MVVKTFCIFDTNFPVLRPPVGRGPERCVWYPVDSVQHCMHYKLLPVRRSAT